jgi:phosphoenolpyruvate carboxykinase (GTP)
VNWFRKDADGKYLWPGYGENVRVLKWMLERIEGKAKAAETPIGFVPTPEAMTLDGLSIAPEKLRELLRVDSADWTQELDGIAKFFEKFGGRLPDGLHEEQKKLAQRLERAATAPK